MVVELWGFRSSPPARMCEMVLSMLDVEYDYRFIDFSKKENYSEDFLKVNPQHNVPVLVDGKLKINESVAIMTYLVEKYGGKSHFLYPNDRKDVKATINQRLFTYSSRFWPLSSETFLPVLFEGADPVREKQEKLVQMIDIMESWVTATGFIAGTKHITLADIAFMVVYATLEQFDDIIVDLDRFKRLKKWAGRVRRAIVHYEKISDGLMNTRRSFLEKWSPERRSDAVRVTKTITTSTFSTSTPIRFRRDSSGSDSDDYLRRFRASKS